MLAAASSFSSSIRAAAHKVSRSVTYTYFNFLSPLPDVKLRFFLLWFPIMAAHSAAGKLRFCKGLSCSFHKIQFGAAGRCVVLRFSIHVLEASI